MPKFDLGSFRELGPQINTTESQDALKSACEVSRCFAYTSKCSDYMLRVYGAL